MGASLFCAPGKAPGRGGAGRAELPAGREGQLGQRKRRGRGREERKERGPAGKAGPMRE